MFQISQASHLPWGSFRKAKAKESREAMSSTEKITARRTRNPENVSRFPEAAAVPPCGDLLNRTKQSRPRTRQMTEVDGRDVSGESCKKADEIDAGCDADAETGAGKETERETGGAVFQVRDEDETTAGCR